jgi:hypothetical protein
MIRLRHKQPSLWETFFGEEVADLWQPRMRAVDELLEDDELLGTVYEAHLRARNDGRHPVRRADRSPSRFLRNLDSAMKVQVRRTAAVHRDRCGRRQGASDGVCGADVGNPEPGGCAGRRFCKLP